MAAAAKPQVQRFLEALAAILGVDQGRQRLEIVFEGGRLVLWRIAEEAKSPDELSRYDDEAGWLVVRAGEI